MNDFLKDKNGQPMLLLGLQAHNSSTGTDMIKKTIHAVSLYGGNLLEAPVYWNKIEIEQDIYDMTLVKDLIDETREAGLKLIILWFAASKNGHPNYTPDYIKLNPQLYRIALGPDKAPVPSLSPHCHATLERDKKAFEKLIGFIREYDNKEHTVMAVQVENEMGYANTDRDYSLLAQEDYDKPVPEEIRDVILDDTGLDNSESKDNGLENKRQEDSGQENSGQMSGIPVNIKQEENGPKNSRFQMEDLQGVGNSTWRGCFGRHAHEAFSSWYHARYINEIAKAGKKIYDIPMIANVMIGEQGYEETGRCYNGGSAVGRMLDIWKKGAPDLDLICPDMYEQVKSNYSRICSRYSRPDNALFIPESEVSGEANAMNAIMAVADYKAIGLCCFGAESALNPDGTLLEEAKTMAVTMKTIAALAPLLVKYHGTDNIHAVIQEEFAKQQYIKLPGYHVLAHFINKNKSAQSYGSRINMKSEENKWNLEIRGRGLLIQSQEDEFYLSGAGIALDFIRRPDPMDDNPYIHLSSRQSGQLNFLSVEEGHFEKDQWVTDYIRNGDESNFSLYVHGGQAVRIRLNPNRGMKGDQL